MNIEPNDDHWRCGCRIDSGRSVGGLVVEPNKYDKLKFVEQSAGCSKGKLKYDKLKFVERAGGHGLRARRRVQDGA